MFQDHSSIPQGKIHPGASYSRFHQGREPDEIHHKKTGEELFYCSYCRAHKENGKELKAPAASVYKKVIDAMERERREEEKMYSAIQQGAGRKAIEAVRADSSMQMKTILAELNMEQFRRVPLYECYMADEITEEQYHAEVLDYEEAHRKLNEQLTAIMENEGGRIVVQFKYEQSIQDAVRALHTD